MIEHLRDVRYVPKADIRPTSDVRFYPNIRHQSGASSANGAAYV